MKILCVGGPLDGKWVEDIGNNRCSPLFGTPFVVYTRQTVSNDTQVFTVYSHSGDGIRSLLHRLVDGYRGGS
jgi:hypothetical protein